jgi:hypothetical protein
MRRLQVLIAGCHHALSGAGDEDASIAPTSIRGCEVAEMRKLVQTTVLRIPWPLTKKMVVDEVYWRCQNEQNRRWNKRVWDEKGCHERGDGE